MDRKRVVAEFGRYVSEYDPSDPKIALKISHTHRVAELCDRVGVSVGVDDSDLAWLCGMLHDIGRFEQVKRYGTFVDAQSVDHAQFGADLLFDEGLIERFVPAGSWKRSDDCHLLETAIRSHSLFQMPDDLTARERVYCNVLRDADKLDIFRVTRVYELGDGFSPFAQVRAV